MADHSKIEWTDATANVINGCSLASPGCTNCYAMKQAHRTDVRRGLTKPSKGGMVWTGEVRFHEPALLKVLGWQKPRMIFWNAHGDMFHPEVPDEWIDRCFAVMALTPQHVHQVLTKRSARMREYLTALTHGGRGILSAMSDLGYENADANIEALYRAPLEKARTPIPPLPNVWLGVSVEDQQRADERIPDLLATPAAVRWLSCEPLLGPVDLRHVRRYNPRGLPWIDALRGLVTRGQYLARSPSECSFATSTQCIPPELPRLDWIVAGGESGPKARPMHPDWARSLRDQCSAAGVPFFFKQWGEWVPATEGLSPTGAVGLNGDWTRGGDARDVYNRLGDGLALVDRVGKKRAGRLLDGVEHNGMPEVVRG